ncbi:efflux RND transporter permease subunit [Paenibacillus sp. 481]|uniref:efflux RND transporter permease subunit n=1 Tax=Paenibacillus sp. 481 TaxID=2835869 RepID=UPI001E53187D|nr:efflux RND transporter permease subunit [Paenibacillus sp. 481]UHA74827.1 efflux RND transporter permease subunit [Paenibacillus sp. 481]
MNALIRFSMKNVAALVIMMAILFGGGLIVASSLKIDLMPNIAFPVVIVETKYNASAQDIIEKVTKPLEKKISGVDKIRSIESQTGEGVSLIFVTLQDGEDAVRKKTDLEALLQEVTLPEDIKPKLSTFGFSSMPSYYLALHADKGISQEQLEDHFQKTIKPAFDSLPGIDKMDVIGKRETRIEINLQGEALRNYGLNPQDVSSEIQKVLLNGPAGMVNLDGNKLIARVEGNITNIYDLDRIELLAKTGQSVRLDEIGKVETISTSDFVGRIDEKPAIGIVLYKTASTNMVQFTDSTDALIEKWKTTLPGVHFQKVFNSSVEIKSSISGLIREGLIGALLASLMILLFLKNMRMTIIVLVSIPLSIVIALLIMKWLDISLNIMTLGGLFIAVGRVVDDSIVVIENIYTRLERAQQRNESVILLATKEVANAITSSTLTTVGVFMPIGMVSGQTGQLFRPFALTMSSALMASLLVALTVIPMLAKVMVLGQKKIHVHDESKPTPLKTFYRRCLEWSLNHRIKTMLLSLLVFIGTMVPLTPQLAFTFMPQNEPSRAFYFTIKLPPGGSLKSMDLATKELEAVLRAGKDSEGKSLFTFIETLVGYNGSKYAQINNAHMYTEVTKAANVDQVKKEYKERLLKMLPTGSEVETQSYSLTEGSGGSDFQYNIRGTETDQIIQAVNMIKTEMKKMPELFEVKDSMSTLKSEIVVAVDQQKASQYGFTAGFVQESLATWLYEAPLGDQRFAQGTWPTVVKMSEADVSSLDAVRQIKLKSPANETVLVGDIAEVKRVESQSMISRKKQEQTVTISAKIIGQDKGRLSGEISAKLGQIKMPYGVTVDVGGVSEQIDESFGQLFLAMAGAIFIVYLIMVLAFGNASAPFAILFSLPFAAIGGVIALFITNESINITSLIGFMMLIGIVVTNAIVYIDKAQQLREEGMDVRGALIEAGLVRMRPIIMTAGATIMALLPLGLGFGTGTLISKGLAVVVIGGLTVSTVLTLIVVPVVYDLLESFKNRMKRIGRGKETNVTT